MTAVRLPTIVTLLRLAGDGDSDDGALRRERRWNIDPLSAARCRCSRGTAWHANLGVHPFVPLAEVLAGVSG